MKAAQILAAGVCLLTLSAAPALAESATVGVEAGVTASSFNPSNDGAGSITLSPGGMAGIYAVVPILKAVSFVPELLYVQKYGSRTGGTVGNPRIEYVEIPLLAKMPLIWGTYFSEGIALGFPVNAYGFAQGVSQTTSPDVAIVIGGGIDIHKFAVEFRSDGGVRRVSTVANAPVQRTRSFILLAKWHL